jgi:CheY-like chemotaxis protein
MEPQHELMQSTEALRILVVDDNVDAAETLALYLERIGYTVRLAHDGARALRVAEELRPHVVLLDLGLPQLDGYEVALAIRAERWGKDVLICAITAWGRPSDHDISRIAGIDHHLLKPVDPQLLVTLIQEARAKATAKTPRNRDR